MGSLSALFNLSRAALTADQAALNATSNNVANQNTVGYTRQVVSFTGTDTVTLRSTGPSTATPQAIATSSRDRILEHRLQQQTQTASSTSARADALTQIENIFSLNSSSANAGSTQLGTDLDGLFSALGALQANSADPATQQGVLSAAATLANDFNASAAQIAQVKAGLSAGVTASLPQINSLAATIASLNGQISSQLGTDSPNLDAGALEDQRQLAITQLSSLIGLDQITTEKNGLTLTTQGGTVLVEGQSAHSLQSGVTATGNTVLDQSGNDVTAGITGGSLGGQLAAQNSDIPAIARQLDSLANQIATAVNAQNSAGYTTTGLPGGAIFSLPASVTGSASAIALLASAKVAPAAAGEGPSGNGNATALAALVTTVGTAGLTLTGTLSALVGSVGTTSAALKAEATTQQATLAQLTTQRDSLSGVSLDDEAANLTQYEKSYEAAAKLLTVLDTLFAAAINIGTQTAVS